MNKKNNDSLTKFEYHFFGIQRKVINFIHISYNKFHRYLYSGNFRKIHIVYGFVKDIFQITSINHSDFIVATQKKLDKLAENKNRERFIKLSLAEALEGCNFIIFSVPDKENKFVQFWTGEHQLKYNFYANDVNKLKNCFLSIIGLLSEIGFVNDDIRDYHGRMTFKIDKGTNYISVDANFRNNLDLAVDFIDIVYKHIYKTKGSKLIAKVE